MAQAAFHWAMARELLLDARKAVLKGMSPALEKQREKRRVHAIETFGTAMDAWFANAKLADSSRRLELAVAKLAEKKVLSLAAAEVERAFAGVVAPTVVMEVVEGARAVGLNITDVVFEEEDVTRYVAVETLEAKFTGTVEGLIVREAAGEKLFDRFDMFPPLSEFLGEPPAVRTASVESTPSP